MPKKSFQVTPARPADLNRARARRAFHILAMYGGSWRGGYTGTNAQADLLTDLRHLDVGGAFVEALAVSEIQYQAEIQAAKPK